MRHYVYLFLADGCSIYSPVMVQSYSVNDDLYGIIGKQELYPGHVMAFSVYDEENYLTIKTSKKELKFKFELPKAEMDVGYLITNILGKVTIRQVDPTKRLEEEKLIRKTTCEMQRVPLVVEESSASKDETMKVPDGEWVNFSIGVIGLLFSNCAIHLIK